MFEGQEIAQLESDNLAVRKYVHCPHEISN